MSKESRAEPDRAGATEIPPAAVDSRRRRARVIAGRLLAIAVLAVLGGCVRGCTSSRPPIHLNPNMDNQPKYRPQAESLFFADGATMRSPVEGTVARGELEADPAFATGTAASGMPATSNPLPVDERLLERGGERFEIYCAPCHGQRGDGRGMLRERAGIESTDLREERLLTVPDGELFQVISDGVGLMPGYRYPIPPADRWAIVAHVRELQAARR